VGVVVIVGVVIIAIKLGMVNKMVIIAI